MANQAADKFLRLLIAATCRKYKPQMDQIELYRERLQKWFLTEQQWATAIESIEREYTDEGLPAIGIVYSYLVTAQGTAGRKPSEGVRLLFTVNNHRFVMGTKDHNGEPILKSIDPTQPVNLPSGAEDGHLAIPRELQYLGDQVDHRRDIQQIIGAVEETIDGNQ